MNSWLIISILSILLLASCGSILLIRWDIKKMTEQLEGIIGNFGTNELIRTNTQSRTMRHFITKLNRLIHFYKEDQQHKERRERELRQEITNISHDLRTPLTSIKGFSELLSDPSLTEAQKHEFMLIIQKKIDSLTTMVDVFYELSQIESADCRIVLERLSLDQHIIEAMLMFHGDFEKRKLAIHLDEAVAVPVSGDRNATNRIVINIIQNALRYAKSYFTLTLIDEEQHVRLRAVNDVEAFDSTELKRIFDRTFTMDASRSGGQLGLGLHIIDQLISKQGGEVTVEVEDDEFRIDVLFRKWDCQVGSN